MNLIKLFNKEYLKENIKKSRGFILLFLILVPLFTALYTVLVLNEGVAVDIIDKLDIMWINVLGMYVIPLVLSFTLFGYIYKKNSVDFINSMPINRKTIFVTNTIGGIILITLMQILTALILVACNALLPDIVIFTEMIVDMFVLMWVSYIFTFVATNLAMTFSGTFLTQITLTMLILFLVPFCIDSYNEFDVERELKLVNEVGYFSEYGFEEDRYTMPYKMIHHIFAGQIGDIYSTKSIFRMIIIGILYFGIGIYLFQKRKMENTEESFSSIKMHIFVKALTILPMIILLNLAEPDIEFVIFAVALIMVYYFIFDFVIKRKITLKVSIPCLILVLVILQLICMGAEGIRENMPEKELSKDDIVAISIGDNEDYSRSWYYNNSLNEWEYFIENKELIDLVFESARDVEEYYSPKTSLNDFKAIRETSSAVISEEQIVIDEEVKNDVPLTIYVDFIFKTKLGNKIEFQLRIWQKDFDKIIEILEKDEKFMTAIRDKNLKGGEIVVENVLTTSEDKEFLEKEFETKINQMSLKEILNMKYVNDMAIFNYYYENHRLVKNIFSIDFTDSVFKKTANILNNHAGTLLEAELKAEDSYIGSFYLVDPNQEYKNYGNVYFNYENDEIIEFILSHYDEEFDPTKPYYMLGGYVRSFRDHVYIYTNRIEEINQIVARNNNLETEKYINTPVDM